MAMNFVMMEVSRVEDRAGWRRVVENAKAHQVL
jgi:hypothetical protein